VVPRHRIVQHVRCDGRPHGLGWSREQVLKYGSEHGLALPPAELDRYIAWPGQALAYKIGELKIRELRQRAERELGPKFDVREFHDVVLRNGAMPLDLLEGEVARYIASVRTRR
jgi:uncharacterized protein (DUF885 family)